VADDMTLREAHAADGAFLLSLARAAYAEVLSVQFAGWDEAVHGTRFAEKVATLPFWVAELNGEPVAALSSSLHEDHLRVSWSAPGAPVCPFGSTPFDSTARFNSTSATASSWPRGGTSTSTWSGPANQPLSGRRRLLRSLSRAQVTSHQHEAKRE
jgi:hypothetical protein